MKRRQQYGNANRIGKTVCRLREKRGLKQKELLAMLQAKGVDIGESGISQLEGQNRAATDIEIQALAEIFKISIEELYNTD